MSEPEIVVVPDAETGASRAAGLIATALADGVAARGDRADWATTGGSTVVAIYDAMLRPENASRIPWPMVHTWWGDERYVPADHPWSNVRPFDDVLLDGGAWEETHSDDPRGRIQVRVANVHPFRPGDSIGNGEGPEGCARELAAELHGASLPEQDGWPVFDLVLLGVGADGHILSVFPGSATFDAPAWAVAVPAPTHIEPHVARVTLNPAIVSVARRVVVVANGGNKAEALGHVFGDELDPHRWPAQLARREGATWIVDEAAAANLPR